MPRTKIVCTLGPASETPEIIRGMIQAGMAVARINFSHGHTDDHARQIGRVREVAREEGRIVAILADLQGPKLRIGDLATGKIALRAGETISFSLHETQGTDRIIHLPHPELVEALKAGDTLLLDDGIIDLRVIENTGDTVHCRVVAGGDLLPRKGISIPHVELKMPAITEKDERDLSFALEQKVDYVALSFVRSAYDVEALREIMGQAGKETPIIAKIEKPQAVDNIEAIINVSYGIMIARGDLGVETPPEEVPLQQKRIIKLARERAKPVITATQMLESMMHNPRPTRAEASDVANAIFDGSDAIMLSGETAIGRYPVEAVRMMSRIAKTTEKALPYQESIMKSILMPARDVTDAITQATCEIAHELQVKAIIPTTMSGYTARMISRHRPAQPILVVTPWPDVRRHLALVWGVESIVVPEYSSTDEMIAIADRAAVKAGLAQGGDLVVITAGIPLGGQGKTNMVKIHTIGAT